MVTSGARRFDSQAQPKRRPRLVRLMVACCCVAGVLNAGAQVVNGQKIDRTRFVARLWSQTRPSNHFDYGCDTAWRSFSFRADGFFVYDGKIAGSWWVNHLYNVDVLTNNGERMELFFDGNSLLTQLERRETVPNSVFGTEFSTYRECPTDKVMMR